MTEIQKLQELVDRFDYHIDAYKSGQYNETQVRRDFIDPLFVLLGWDVDNRDNNAEAYRDVIHEDTVKIGATHHAPDYCFRVGGTRKFFLEAKKPSVHIKEDVAASYQLRRYGWSAKLPISILTDFEEFAVYDTRVKPHKSDKVSTARIDYLTYDQYVEKWDDLYNRFSKEAIYKGAFDKYVETQKVKKGTGQVDAAFLAEIESWRSELARNIHLRNAGLSTRDLNYAVQAIIDRIIFLRMCEDRGIEHYAQLRGLINGTQVYPRLCQLFRQADDRYNSGLFHFDEEKGRSTPPDGLTLGLTIDDKVLKSIFRNLYYPDSPYEFSALPTEILGEVYEQFLGKVITIKGRSAIVEEKPEVKKAGGVYYTPQYIVDYIVDNTVGALLQAKQPGKAVDKIKILDPACGSGSFLLGAYQHLLDWYRDRYAENTRKHKKVLYQTQGGEWRLTTQEKKRILLTHIHGVDIDPQAVEVTKLSLLLKVLEGESDETLRKNRLLFHQRALPDLGSNIQCGNSLIGPDFYKGRQLDLLDEEEQYRINAFDWHAEFKEIMQSGGFDAVIGNPPYGMTEEKYKNYYNSKYKTLEGRIDNFELFIERGSNLFKKSGYLSFIVPSPLLTNLYSRKLRQFIRDKFCILEITNFGIDVFADPTIHTCIFVLKNQNNPNNITKIKKQITSIEQLHKNPDYTINQSDLGQNPNFSFDVFIDPKVQNIFNKIKRNSSCLGDICFIRQCIKTGNDKEYVREFSNLPKAPWKPTLRGKDINRYKTSKKNLYLKYGTWLARNWKNTSFYETPKIMVRETGKRITSTLDLNNHYLLSSLYAIYPKVDHINVSLMYLLGILNSALSTFVIKKVAYEITQGAFTKIRTNQLSRLPIKSITPSNPEAQSQHDRMVELVERMLELNKKLDAAKTAQDKTHLQRQIEATDREIDQLVYALYGLTDDEIALVEESVF